MPDVRSQRIDAHRAGTTTVLSVRVTGPTVGACRENAELAFWKAA
jgi:hypothetical protein